MGRVGAAEETGRTASRRPDWLRLGWVRLAAQRLRADWLLVVEGTAAATVAWVVDTEVFGHRQPFFAPAAALIILGQARGVRLRRAVEVLIGVAGGVLVAELITKALGPHTTLTVFVVILLTMGGAIALDAGPIGIVQAAVSAVYIAVVPATTDSIVPSRFVDALVGGGVAIVASQLAVARNPLGQLSHESRKVFTELAAVLDDVAGALERADEPAASAALTRARRVDAAVDRLASAVVGAGESLRFHVRRRTRIGAVRAVDEATRQVDYFVRNVRVLARAGVTLTRQGVTAPPSLVEVLRTLAEAVRVIDDAFADEFAGRGAEAMDRVDHAEDLALRAVAQAGRSLPHPAPVPLVMVVGQVRATVIDLLRIVHSDDVDILTRVDAAFGLPSV